MIHIAKYFKKADCELHMEFWFYNWKADPESPEKKIKFKAILKIIV